MLSIKNDSENFYAASFSILFVQHLTKRMDTTEVMHFHRTTQQSVFFFLSDLKNADF